MEETFDIYTIDNKATGETAPRAQAHRKALWHRTVHIWVQNEEGALLLQKRADDKDSHPSLWDISAAGHIPAGETIINAALRECEEELGLILQPEDLVKIGTTTQHFDFPENEFYDREHVTLFLVQTTLTIEAFTPQLEEVSALRYISSNELEQAISEKASWLVPHWKEYENVLSYLKS